MLLQYGKGSGDTDRGLSPRLWRGSRVWEAMGEGRVTNVKVVGDDFFSLPASTAGGKYVLLEADDKASFAILPSEDTGVLRLAMTGDDNEEANLLFGGGEGVVGAITEGSGIKTYFEARIRVNSVADDEIAIYCGLAEEGMTGANMQTDDTGVLSAKDYCLFRSLHVNSGVAGTNAILGAAFNTDSGTEVEKIASAYTLVADTWVKVGLYHDGESKIQYFIDGVPNAAESDPSDTTFPDGEELSFALGAKLGSDASVTLDCDWWRAARVDMWADA